MHNQSVDNCIFRQRRFTRRGNSGRSTNRRSKPEHRSGGRPKKTPPRPPLPQLRLRFIWASIFIVFIPLFAYAGLRHLLNIPPKGAFGAALIWLILPWGFALFHPDRQFLYDFLAGTRLVDLNQKKTNE